jgi:hypothetical protein
MLFLSFASLLILRWTRDSQEVWWMYNVGSERTELPVAVWELNWGSLSWKGKTVSRGTFWNIQNCLGGCCLLKMWLLSQLHSSLERTNKHQSSCHSFLFGSSVMHLMLPWLCTWVCLLYSSSTTLSLFPLGYLVIVLSIWKEQLGTQWGHTHCHLTSVLRNNPTV